MGIRTSARIGAFACLGVALGLAALTLRGGAVPAAVEPMPIETAAPVDPLPARMLQCQLAGEAAGSDPGCLAAWAENRRRFLGLRRARPVEPSPAGTVGADAVGLIDRPRANGLSEEH